MGQISLPQGFVEHNCIFIHVPKCAGTSIKHSIFKENTLGHMPLWWYEINFPEFYARAFKFSFVRDPLSRAYSSYNYLRLKENGKDPKACEMALRYDTFDSFVKNWLCEENALRQIHFTPQWQFLTNEMGHVDMDFIGKQENFANDFDSVCRSLGVQVAPAKKNVFSSNESLAVDTKTVDKIHRIYERDYELFAY